MPLGIIDITLTSCFTGWHPESPNIGGVMAFCRCAAPDSSIPLGVIPNHNQGKPDIPGFY